LVDLSGHGSDAKNPSGTEILVIVTPSYETAKKVIESHHHDPPGIIRNVEPVLVQLLCRTPWFVQVSVTSNLQGPMVHTGISDRYLVGPHGSYRYQ